MSQSWNQPPDYWTEYIYDLDWRSLLAIEDSLFEADAVYHNGVEVYSSSPDVNHGLLYHGCGVCVLERDTIDSRVKLTVHEVSSTRSYEYMLTSSVLIGSLKLEDQEAELVRHQMAFPILTDQTFETTRGNADQSFLFMGYVLQYRSDKALWHPEEVKLDLFEHLDKERKRYERLRLVFDGVSESPKTTRQPNSEQIRILVWHRDGGKCTKCGNREKLEYDHIIPVSKGGSNTARNIELLCEACNRSKSDKIQ